MVWFIWNKILSAASSWSHCTALQALETPQIIWIKLVKSPSKDPARCSGLSYLYDLISQLMKNICKFSLFSDDAQKLSIVAGKGWLSFSIIIFITVAFWQRVLSQYFIELSKYKSKAMSIRCASFGRKLIVFHNTVTKSPYVFNLSVSTFLAYAIKSKKIVIFPSQTGTLLFGGVSGFSSKTFVISCLAAYWLLWGATTRVTVHILVAFEFHTSSNEHNLYSLIINNNTRRWNIVAGWSKYYFDLKNI